MNKKTFHSQLFKRQVEVTEQDYWPIVKAETLFRIKDLEIRNCSCFKCKQDLEKLNEFLAKLLTTENF
jgi:hypothetical protein